MHSLLFYYQFVNSSYGFVSKSQQYAPLAFKELSVYNQFIDLSSLSKQGISKIARRKRMDILKLKRLNRKNQSSELLTKPEDIDDFVCFLASDSESDNDDDMDINITTTATKPKNRQTHNVTKDALFSSIGLTDTG
ncbi:hypothetical protein Bca52824_023880 [Brassica carinata]|uniref:Uncharacterized protein n=1 Tax=Brassica carinata TaxID=52824 RepID=A0A8X8AV49_BRACI|nr:hypothetical protein Bca52824_023880 [Brassica carinata]